MATEYPDLSEIRFLLTDVDDTLTTDGQLLAETLDALYQLDAAGITVIPVTGGCAGWCDSMIRLWPVKAVVGENGAFCFYKDEQSHINSIFWQEQALRESNQQRLSELADQALQLSPNARLAKDQPFRLADVAIDYNQDVSGVTEQQLNEMLTVFHNAGAHARISSIHINAWFGEYSKQAMSVRVLEQLYGLSTTQILSQAAYIGDAPNDEPMFEFFRHTFGVANIQRHLTNMTHHPKTLTKLPSGKGFAELARQLLR